jgi:Arc/MetJ-type ribon-helix-helix transcriptional regulator
MTVNMPAEFEPLVEGKLRSGEYRSAEDIVQAAMCLFQQREEDRAVLRAVNEGEALPFDDRFEARLEALLDEAEQSGEPTDMTPADWADIRREGIALIQSRKPA